MTVSEDNTHDLSSGIDFDSYEIDVVVSQNAPKVPDPKTFDEFDFPKFLAQNIRRVGFVKPTPVQRTGISLIKAGCNLEASSQSGSGKTAAYLLPIIGQLGERHNVDPRALILVPTRELALQVKRMADEFTKGSQLKVALAYGGKKWKAQFIQIKEGCDILVATPGRLKHFLDLDEKELRKLQEEDLNLSLVRYVVLDEADKLLGKQFREDVDEILSDEDVSYNKKDRQTLLFSRPGSKVDGLFILSGFVRLEVTNAAGAESEIDIIKREVEGKDSFDVLVEILKNDVGRRTLIVAKDKKVVDQIHLHLTSKGIESVFIHGEHDQMFREEAIKSFRSGHVRILTGSGAICMGLDVRRLGHIVDFNRRSNINDYVLRLDRTDNTVRGKISFISFLKSVKPRVQVVNVAEKDYPLVRHKFLLQPAQKKMDELVRLRGANPQCLTIIFCQARAVRGIVEHLNINGYPTAFFPGGKAKKIELFKTGVIRTLVTSDSSVTDILGIQVDIVINFVLPPFHEYVKLANKVSPRGGVISFYLPHRDRAMAGQLRRLLIVAKQEIPMFLGVP